MLSLSEIISEQYTMTKKEKLCLIDVQEKTFKGRTGEDVSGYMNTLIDRNGEITAYWSFELLDMPIATDAKWEKEKARFVNLEGKFFNGKITWKLSKTQDFAF